MTESSSVQDGACSGHAINGDDEESGEEDVPEIAENSPIQDVTLSQCQALPTFTGSNNDAVRTVTDNRGGTTSTYEIAKLADGNCWMLNNLKLGSMSGDITLTSADSDVGGNFTLPQLTSGGNIEIDLPRAYGPVPGDVGTTNYGYLYNFAAATAGETQSSLTAGNAPYSICPANWRLPTGNSLTGKFGQLDVSFGGTGAYVSGGSPSIPQWQPSGPFRGSFYGDWFLGFRERGGWGYLWSASAITSSVAFYAAFGPSNIYPGGTGVERYYGFGVRCLLN